MPTVTIKMTGHVQALIKLRGIGAAAAQLHPIATFGSRLFYAPIVEKRWRTGSGGARMFERGVRDAATYAVPVLKVAIPKGPQAISQAKGAIRDFGLQRIKELTPVKTGALRDSVSELNRPGGIN